MPKIVNKEKMKDTILEASLKAFLTYGFQKTTMDKIAKEAKIAKGTLYLYFDSKEELSLTLFNLHIEKLKEKLVFKEDIIRLDALLKHLKTALLQKEKQTFHPLFLETFNSNESSKEIYQSFIEEIEMFYEKILINLQNQNEINQDIQPKTVAKLLIRLLNSLILYEDFTNNKNSEYTDEIEMFLEILKKSCRVL